MFLNRFVVAISLLLCTGQVLSSPKDLESLKEHFFANLLEENREISSFRLTDDVEREINLKIEGFLEVVGEPSSRSRVRRDTNDLLLNEKSESVKEIFYSIVNHVLSFERIQRAPFAYSPTDESLNI